MTASDHPEDDKKMPLLDHLIELRGRLIWSFVVLIALFVVCYYFAPDIFNFLVRPLAQQYSDPSQHRLIYTALHEAFFTYAKLAFFAAAFLGFPFFAIQIWLFVAPGLYRHEKRAFLPFLIATPFLFFLGGALVYTFVIPVAWHFFLSFQQMPEAGQMAIELQPKVNEYLSLIMQLIFAFGLVFELPVLLTLLVRVGIVSVAALASKRRYAIVLAFIAAAILTPPDVVSQVSLAIPIILLYEVSIFIGRLIERRRDADAKAEAAADDDTATPTP